jgi:inhibitor of cysteine peptidase
MNRRRCPFRTHTIGQSVPTKTKKNMKSRTPLYSRCLVFALLLLVACATSPGQANSVFPTPIPIQTTSTTQNPIPNAFSIQPKPTHTQELPSPLATDNSPISQQPATDIITGHAYVEHIQISIPETSPTQALIQVYGNLADGCTNIHHIDEQRIQTTFTITITTQRLTEALCTQVLVPFEQTISLDISGLDAGTYAVIVNGVRDSFNLSSSLAKPEE